MFQEIERKFLVLEDKLPDLSNLTPIWISQAYLWRQPEIRVRISKRNSDIWCSLTFKDNSYFSRREINIPIPIFLADRLMGFCIGNIIKERFSVPRPEKSGWYWELDRFISKKSFWLAEVELETEQEFLITPKWIEKEVTHNPKYYTRNMSQTLYKSSHGT